MYRASTLLTNARIDKDLEVAEIAKKLKIPIKYLLAFESENICDFPQEPYCSLIIKEYAQHLGLNGDQILLFFRRDFDSSRCKEKNIRPLFSFTPQFTFTAGTILLVLVFCGYLVLEYIKFNSPPKLKINWPVGNTVLGSTFDISGSTSTEATVKINDNLVIVSPNGTFQKKLSFSTDEAKVKIESKSASGKITVEEKTIKVSH